MAEIFLAEQPGPAGFSKRIAIKRILPHRADDPEFVEMFRYEARLAGKLSHPNVVEIFELGEVDHVYFLAMEYVEGYDFGQILDQLEAKKELIPPAVAARLISQAAAGLHYAHSFRDPDTGQHLGLIHRDISLPNLMFAMNGVVKVLDFGIAKAAVNDSRAPTQTGILKGKISYMSPEYLMGHGIDNRHDLFALGVLMYEMLTRQKPFRAKGDVQMLQAILTQEPQDPFQFHPNLPPDLVAILQQMLAKSPTERFQTGAEIETAMEDFILHYSPHELTGYHLTEYVRSLFSSQPTQLPGPLASSAERLTGAHRGSTGALPRPAMPPLASAPASRPPTQGGFRPIPNQGAVHTAEIPAFGEAPSLQRPPTSQGVQRPPTSQGVQRPPTSAQGLQRPPRLDLRPDWSEETRTISLPLAQGSSSPGQGFDDTPSTAALVLQPGQSLELLDLKNLPPGALSAPPPEKSPAPPPETKPSTSGKRSNPRGVPSPPQKSFPWLFVVLPVIVLALGLTLFFLLRSPDTGAQADASENADASGLASATPPPPSERPLSPGEPRPPQTPTPPSRLGSPSEPLPPRLPPQNPPIPSNPPAPPPLAERPQALDGGQAPPPLPQPLPDISKPPVLPSKTNPPVEPPSDDPIPITLPKPGETLVILKATRPCPCTVHWRGQELGKTPISFPLPLGGHEIMLRRESPFLRLPVRLSVQSNDTIRKTVGIRQGWLDIRVNWPSKIYLNSTKTYIGTSSQERINVYEGYHTVIIDNIRRLSRPLRRSVFVPPGATRRVDFSLP